MARNKRRSQPRQRSSENRGAEAITVVWMVSVMTTLVCGVVAGIIWLAAGNQPGAEHPRLFGRLLHFSAFVTGSVSLVLLAAVLKFRSKPPPPAITWFAVAVALLAIGTALLY